MASRLTEDFLQPAARATGISAPNAVPMNPIAHTQSASEQKLPLTIKACLFDKFYYIKKEAGKPLFIIYFLFVQKLYSFIELRIAVSAVIVFRQINFNIRAYSLFINMPSLGRKPQGYG